MANAELPVNRPSIARGAPLCEEQGIGALTLGGFLIEVTARYREREAAVQHQGGTVVRWSYGDLFDRAMEVARALAACGVGKGTRVGILATNRLEFLSCTFGTALAGGIVTTISTFCTPAELDGVLGQACCPVLLFESRVLGKDFAAMLSGLEPGLAEAPMRSTRFPFMRHLVMIDREDGEGAIEGWSSFLARGEAVSPARIDAAAATVTPADPGVLFFSSGSTGKAKGILSAHRGVCLQLWRWPAWFDLRDAPRTCSANGFFWSGNFAMALGSTLARGGCLVLQRWFDAEEALALMERECVTLVLAWPHQRAQLAGATGFAAADLSSLLYVDADSPIARHPSVTTAWREPAHTYGNTETFTLCAAFPAGTPPEITLGSHGLPTAGTTIKIVDPLTGETVPMGERGEIAVKGPTLMLGYLGVPLDDTLDDEGYLRTGDGGYLDDLGRLFWEGRLNDIIKTGGANVSPLEVDAVIRECPGVKVSQTVGVPDDLLGECVVTCVVAHDRAELEEPAIRAFARRKLASYKVPRRVLFFGDADLKTTGSAKIRTDELRKLAAARLAREGR